MISEACEMRGVRYILSMCPAYACSWWLVLSTLLLAACQSWEPFAVPYGERSTRMEAPSDRTVRLFLDAEGFPYPEGRIRDRSLKKAGNSLKNWFLQDPERLQRFLAAYGLADTGEPASRLDRLREAILFQKVRTTNKGTKEESRVYVLIHGFRKKAYGKRKRTSEQMYAYLQNRIRSVDPDAFFLEVYWDGKHISPIKAFKYRGFRLFEQAALPAADRAGEGLQPVLSAIRTDTLTLLAHSLGARVALQALTSSPMDTLPTPSQARVDIWLVGPAIGSEAFDPYYRRNTTVNFQQQDNYRLTILYNEGDFVLNKTFRWAFLGIDVPPTQFGNTSLGCNFDSDLQRLRQTFRERFTGSPPPVFVEVRTDKRGKAVTCHRIQCYLGQISLSELLD